MLLLPFFTSCRRVGRNAAPVTVPSRNVECRVNVPATASTLRYCDTIAGTPIVHERSLTASGVDL